MTTTTNNFVSKMIREVRLKHEMTRIDMADRLNMSLSAYGKLESGTSSISVNRLFEISKFLEEPITIFFPEGLVEDKSTRDLVTQLIAELTLIKENSRNTEKEIN